jgi:hypothetical protein
MEAHRLGLVAVERRLSLMPWSRRWDLAASLYNEKLDCMIHALSLVKGNEWDVYVLARGSVGRWLFFTRRRWWV